MTPRFTGVLLLSLCFASVTPAQSQPESRVKKPPVDPSIAAHAGGVAALKQGLLDLAEWAASQKLDRERMRTLELVIVLDPDHEAAREALGYVRAKSGGWERPKKWADPANRDTEALGDYKKKCAEVGGAFLDTMTKVLDENRHDMDPAMRARIIGDMTAVNASDPRTKRAGGEDQAGGKWVLAETAQAPVRRKQLQNFAKAAISAAGTPELTDPVGNDNTIDIKWAAIVATENYRVMGTGTKDEIMKAAVLVQASGDFFSKVFQTENPSTTAYRVPIYLVADANAKANVLKHLVKPEERERVAKLGGAWVDGGVASWGADAAARIDAVVRQIMGQHLGRGFGIGSHDTGALFEGLGIHLSWYLTNTRLTWFIGKRKYAQQGPDPVEDKLRKADADWFGMSYDHWGGKSPPSLRPLLAKHLNDLDPDDMLSSYGFAVWLIDGRKDDAPRFMRRAGRNKINEGAREAFGLEVEQVEARVARWAKESRGKN